MQFTLDCRFSGGGGGGGGGGGQSSLTQGWSEVRDDERHFISNNFSAGRMFTCELMRRLTEHRPL